jgi:hypothetical protein
LKCDYCNQKAHVNYQKVWVRYKVKKDESYELDGGFNGCDIGPTNEDNLHLCAKHESEWLEGKL